MLCLETTQGDIEHQLLEEERAERAQANNDLMLVHATTPSMFLSIGLDLENQQ